MDHIHHQINTLYEDNKKPNQIDWVFFLNKIWICPVCDEKHDRDVNAAKN